MKYSHLQTFLEALKIAQIQQYYIPLDAVFLHRITKKLELGGLPSVYNYVQEDLDSKGKEEFRFLLGDLNTSTEESTITYVTKQLLNFAKDNYSVSPKIPTSIYRHLALQTMKFVLKNPSSVGINCRYNYSSYPTRVTELLGFSKISDFLETLLINNLSFRFRSIAENTNWVDCIPEIEKLIEDFEKIIKFSFPYISTTQKEEYLIYILSEFIDFPEYYGWQPQTLAFELAKQLGMETKSEQTTPVDIISSFLGDEDSVLFRYAFFVKNPVDSVEITKAYLHSIRKFFLEKDKPSGDWYPRQEAKASLEEVSNCIQGLNQEYQKSFIQVIPSWINLSKL